MAEVEKARQVLEAERQAVLDELRQVADEIREEQNRRSKIDWRIREQSHELLLRGKAAGVPVKDMAEAWDATRQRTHIVIREAEQEAARRSKRGKSDA